MINPMDNIVIRAQISLQARVTVDADPATERVILMHRDTGEVYFIFKLVSPIITFTVPYPHAINNTLLVGILDDDRTYNCKFIDGVRAENINVNEV